MKLGMFASVGLLVVAAVAALILSPGEEAAEAGFETEDLSELLAYVKSDAAWNLRLCALEAMQKKSGSEEKLSDLAAEGDVRLAVYACTFLGRKKSTEAKARLKSVLESTSLDIEVRKAAMTAIAAHWKDTGDRSYLASKASGNSVLEGHKAWLDRKVYGK